MLRNLVALGLAVGIGGWGLIAQQRTRSHAPAVTGIWRTWLREDVRYIITDEERQAFPTLKTDEERRQFIQQFWRRRDPTPDTQTNEYKEEHYRRIASADERYSTLVAGSKTDRGMVYIKYGPPDEIESHPTGGPYQGRIEQGGGETSTFPFEIWRYRHMEGVGTGVEIEFVDSTKSGDYHIALDPEEKDVIPYVPGTGEPKKTDGPTHRTYIGPGKPPRMGEIIGRESLGLVKPPVMKYKDLVAIVNSDIRYNTLPMQVRTDYTRVTHATVAADVMVQFRNSNVRIFGQVRDLNGRVVDWFEDALTQELPTETLEQRKPGSQVYFKRLLLAPGVYKLNLAAGDSEAHTFNTFAAALNVPVYEAETLGASSLILADQLERVPAIGPAEPFVIRSWNVRPRIDAVFKPSETMGIYVEFYNFGYDAVTKRPKGAVEYQIVDDADGRVQATFREELADVKAFPKAPPFLVTVARKYPLESLAPGHYTLQMKVDDQVKNKTLTLSANFTVAGS